MPVLLGDLRQYCVDHGRQGNSAKAATIYLRLINDAIREIRSEHDWSRFNKVDQLPLTLSVDGTDVTVASGGTTLTFGSGETVLQRYVDEDWKIRLAGDAWLPLRIGQISSPSVAELADGQEWVGDAVASGSYTWYRDTYDLTFPAQKIHSVTIHNFNRELAYLPRYEFDRLRIHSVTDVGDPTISSLSGNKLLIWPSPSSSQDRKVLIVSYVTAPQEFVATDSNETEVDWEVERKDLLHAALGKLLAERFPGSTRTTLSAALSLYQNRLSAYKFKDGSAYRVSRSMGLDTTGFDGGLRAANRERRFHGPVTPGP